jgi:hypothetical protein
VTAAETGRHAVWVEAGHRTHGVIAGSRQHQHLTLITVRWDDGRRGTFIAGREPDELHITGSSS